MEVVRNDAATVDELLERKPDRVVVSPGPCTPNEAGISVETMRRFPEAGVPTLGVCLGHQSLAQAFGGVVVRDRPVHGKTSEIDARRAHDLRRPAGDPDGRALPLARRRSRPPARRLRGVRPRRRRHHGDPPPRAARRGRPVPSRVRADGRRASSCWRTSCRDDHPGVIPSASGVTLGIVPTSKPRYAITDTAAVARTLDAAARRWPELAGDRKALLLRVLDAGAALARCGRRRRRSRVGVGAAAERHAPAARPRGRRRAARRCGMALSPRADRRQERMGPCG